MDTQRTKKVSYSKASIALVAALSCLLIYILACVLSPPTWSPDSSKIAILVTHPVDDPDMFAIFTYDIATGERALLDQVKTDGILSAPAWSPDGKWIAYYRVDPSPAEEPPPTPQADPNATASTVESTQQASPKRGVNKVKEQAKEKVTAEELFSEENKMLPSFLLDIVKEKLAEEEEDLETFDVKLMAVRPDGKERKILRVMKWQGGENTRQVFVYIRPEWSSDSESIFYLRSSYIASLDIDSGETYIHLFGATLIPLVSPNGNSLASWLEDTLILARVDGTMSKYLKIGEPSEFSFATWSPDSRTLLLTTKKAFLLIDTNTGDQKLLRDPGAELLGYGHFSPDGDSIYYLAGYQNDDPNSPEDRYGIKSMNLKDKRATVLSAIPEEISIKLDSDALTQFSVSPNGRMFLVRGIKEETGDHRSILLFWDGTTRKIVETDRWLMKPLYSEEDLIFEEKLIGKWKDEDGEMLVSEGTQEKTYKITFTEKDGDKYHCAAHLVKLKGMMFMGIFLNESVLQKKDSYGSHLLPDGFMKIDKIEPKLLLREEMDYDELAKMLKKDPNSFKQETEKFGEVFEYERVSVKPRKEGKEEQTELAHEMILEQRCQDFTVYNNQKQRASFK